MRQQAAPGAAPLHEEVRTNCGGHVTVGRLALGDRRHPARRVFVDLGECPGCHGTRWAGLTIGEARRLADALLSQAAAAQREDDVPGSS